MKLKAYRRPMDEDATPGYWTPQRRKEFGQRLTEAREAKEISRERLAEKMGIKSRAAVGHWETGARTPDVGTLAHLCELLDASAEKLLLGTERWPFPKVDFEKVMRLDRDDRIRLEGALTLAAAQLGLSVDKRRAA